MKTQLFFIHFAGGNRYSFRFISPFLKDFEIFPVELPGRGERMGEELLTDFNLAVKDIYEQIVKQIRSPDFIIFGHSMGADLALDVTKMLEQSGLNPRCIFVSGNPGPGVKTIQKRSSLNDDDFVEELKRLGGMQKEVLENKEVLDFFLPVIRADFEIVEKSDIHSRAASKLNTAIFALMGDQEEYADQITNWNNFTTSDFSYKLLSGGHFFLYEHGQAIGNLILMRTNHLHLR